MTARSQKIVEHYDREAGHLAALYDSVSFASVHPKLAKYMPKGGSDVLDVGSGSGRDALALAGMGYRVAAAEPSSNLRLHASISDAKNTVLWLEDSLPVLKRVRDLGTHFDLILCSAVLMLISEDDLFRSVANMASLLKTGGLLIATVRSPIHLTNDILFTNHSTDDLLLAGKSASLILTDLINEDDALGRTSVNWRTFIWRKS